MSEKRPKKPLRNRPWFIAIFAVLRIAKWCLVIAVSALIVIAAYKVGYSVFNGEPADPTGASRITYTIEPGTGIIEVAKDLKEADVIDSALVMIIQSRVFKCTIMPGTYELDSSMTSMEILDWIGSISHSVDETETETETETEALEETETETGTETETAEVGP